MNVIVIAQMHTFHLQLLGPFEASTAQGVVPLPKSKKARALLAYLAEAGKPVARDQLVSLFFSDVADPKGGLRWCISRLRAGLGADSIVTNKAQIGLARDHFHTDTQRLTEALTLDDAAVIDSQNTLSLDGEFLTDLEIRKLSEYENWRLGQQVYYTEQKSALLERMSMALAGSPAGVEHAQRLVALNATSERAWALHVRALKALGHLQDARKVQHLAIVTLEREGVQLTGELAALWHAPTGAKTPIGFDLDHLPPRVEVAPTAGPSEHPDLISDVGAVLFRAISVNKTFTVIAPAIAGPDLRDGELLLRSSVSVREAETVVNVTLIDRSTSEAVTNWRFASACARDQIGSDLEAFFCARFEIDLPLAMIARARMHSAKGASAMDDYLLALPRLFTADGFDPAGAFELLESALAKKPYFGQACSALALVRNFIPALNDDDDELAITLSLARRAIETCQDDAFALGIAAIVVGHQSGDVQAGLHVARRALSINPFSIMAGVAASILSHYAGDDEAALRYVEAVESHSDTDPTTFFCWTCRSMICYGQKEYTASLEWAYKAVGQNPRFIIALRYLLASLGQIGMTEEGEALASQIVAYDPSETLDYFRRRTAYATVAGRDHLCEGLEKAGLR